MIRNKFISDGLIYTVANFLVAGIPFCLLPLLTRVLDPEAYGKIAMFSVVVACISIFSGLNVHGAVMVRYFDRQNFVLSKYITTVLLLLLVTTTIIVLFILVEGSHITKFTGLPSTWLIVATILAALQFVTQLILTLWQSSKKPFNYGVLRLMQALTDGIASIILVFSFTLSWHGRISGMLIASALTALIAFKFMAIEGWLNRRGSISYAKDALKFGVPLVPHALAGLVLGMADRVMVTNYLDIGSTGIYMVAVQIGAILLIFVDAVNKVYAPWLIGSLGHISQEKKIRIVWYSYMYYIALITISLFFGWLVKSFLLKLFVGDKYAAAAEIIPLIFLGYAFTGMYYTVTNYIFFAKKTIYLSSLTLIIGSITFLLYKILLDFYGLYGIALGFCMGQAIMFLGAWILAQIVCPMPWNLFLNKNIIRT